MKLLIASAIVVIATAVFVTGETAAPQAAGIPIVIVAGCVARGQDGAWLLTSASEPRVSAIVHADAKEVAEARNLRLGTGRYRLIGTAEFASADDLLGQGQRAQFTRPEGANATGQLRAGRRVSIKGLLIAAENEQRLNLLSVQPIADACP
jgi:hypothetical protein